MLPKEYAAVQLYGALSIDVKAAGFDWVVSALALNGQYLVNGRYRVKGQYLVHGQGGGRAATAPPAPATDADTPAACTESPAAV